MACARCERDEDDGEKIRRTAFTASGKESFDFLFGKDAVAAWLFFEFFEIKAGIFGDPMEFFGGVGEKRGKRGEIAINGSGAAIWVACKELSFFADEIGGDVDEGIGTKTRRPVV